MCRGDGVDRIDGVDGVEGDDRGVSGDWTEVSKEGEGGGEEEGNITMVGQLNDE